MHFLRYTSGRVETHVAQFCSSSKCFSPFLRPSSIRFFHNKLDYPADKLLLQNYVVGAHRLTSNNYVRHISTSPHLSSNNDNSSIVSFITESNVVHTIQDILVKFHDVTGLSWWATVIISTLAVRTIFLLPLAIHQHYISAKLEEVNKSLDTDVKAEITKQVNDLSKKNNWDSKTMSQIYKKMTRERRHEMIIKNNCHPAKTLITVLIQAPIWVCLSSALRNLVLMLPSRDIDAQIIFLQMKASSFLWLSDLTLPDQTWTIPICLAAVNLFLLQVNYLARKQQKGIGKLILVVFRCFSVYMAYISSTVPSIISLYWLTSSCYGFAQNVMLLTPKVRKLFGIPITDSIRKNPIQYMFKKAEGVVRFFKY